jgi:hypothetical protein
MRIAYLGNFVPPYSTENEVLRALRVDHQVTPVQEGRASDLNRFLRSIRVEKPDLLLWTRTKSLSDRVGRQMQRTLLDVCTRAGVPVVGYHLDRWWGLPREREIATELYFQIDLLITADGGHQELWEKAGVRHGWLPPAVSAKWCFEGRKRSEYEAQIAFVGNWQSYHPEWEHRMALVEHLRRRWPQTRFWPEPGQGAIRGTDLTDLYASVDVMVGDSCLVPNADGSPCTRYCSDRIPETLGRGGVLLHPWVEGITDGTFFDGGYVGHLFTWELGDFDDLDNALAAILSDPPETTDKMRVRAREHVLANHTYEVRVDQILDLCRERGLL